MRMYLNLEESAGLRQYALDLIKSQIKHIVRNELNMLLKEQLADQIKAVSDSLHGKLRNEVVRYLNDYYVNNELHEMVKKFINTQLKSELANVLAVVKDNMVSMCLHNIGNEEDREEK